MFLKTKILEIFNQKTIRFFKGNLLSCQTSNLVQFHSGGDDYCPMLETEGLGGAIGNNPRGGFVFGWRDDIERKSQPGEKRLYSLKKDEETGEITVAAELYLKNDGTIEIAGGKDLSIVVLGDCNLKASKVNIDAEQTNLGKEGANIARVGDEIEVEITSGSSAGTYTGKITSGGNNTSI